MKRMIWQKFLAVMVSLALMVAMVAAPAFADDICTATGGTLHAGGNYKVDVYATASFSQLIGSVSEGASIRVTQQFTNQNGERWARYASSNTASGFAYIPGKNLSNCKPDNSGGNNNASYQQGYRDGIQAARRALDKL